MYEIKKMQPNRHSTRKDKSIYPLRELKVGEGFYAPLQKKGTLGAMVCRLNKELGRHLSVHKVDAERVQVVRREDPK